MLYIRSFSIIICVLFLASILTAQIPTQFALHQNNPNPFDSSGTDIRFECPTQAFINLWVDDTLGTQVIMLLSSQLSAGFYQVRWNARNHIGNLVQPGYYFCKMTAPGFRDSIRMQYQTVVSVNEVNSNIETFNLLQNYPNPFNSSTTIEYHLPVSTNVKLMVYDILGREVVSLVNDKISVGVHRIVFDAGGLPSGLYYYRLQAGSYVETRKLLLLK